MLRLANYYSGKLFGNNATVENLPFFDSAIEEIGPENIVQVFAPSGNVTFNRILYEDPSGPRSTCPGCHGFICPEDDFVAIAALPFWKLFVPPVATMSVQA